MKIYIILAVALACLTSCQTNQKKRDPMIAAAIADLQEQFRQAGVPTDARLRAASGKIKDVSFPCDYRVACETVGIPAIWIAGRCSDEEEGDFLWLKFTYPDAGSISFKTRNSDLLNVFDMRIEIEKGSNKPLQNTSQ